MPMMPRYAQNDQSGYNPPPTTNQSSMHQSNGSIYGGQSGMAQQQQQRGGGYQRQYSEPTISSAQYSEFDSMPPKPSAARPITNKHLRNE